MPTACNHKILFATAYTELPPTGGGFYNQKSLANYYVSFLQLAWNLATHPLLVYLESDGAMARNLELVRPPLPSTVEIITDPINGTFLQRFRERTQAIIDSQQFRALLPSRTRQLRLPEYTSASYTLVNHDKISVIHDAWRRYQHYTHFLWVDFGQVQKSLWFVPRSVDACKLPGNQVLYLGDSKFLRRSPQLSPRDLVAVSGSPDRRAMNQLTAAGVSSGSSSRNGSSSSGRSSSSDSSSSSSSSSSGSGGSGSSSGDAGSNSNSSGDIAVCGTAFAVPGALVASFAVKYEAELLRFFAEGVVDDDQSIVYSLWCVRAASPPAPTGLSLPSGAPPHIPCLHVLPPHTLRYRHPNLIKVIQWPPANLWVYSFWKRCHALFPEFLNRVPRRWGRANNLQEDYIPFRLPKASLVTVNFSADGKRTPRTLKVMRFDDALAASERPDY